MSCNNFLRNIIKLNKILVSRLDTVLNKIRQPYLQQFQWFHLGKQQLLSVGDNVGTLHIMEVPWNLRRPSVNEVHVSFILTLSFSSISCLPLGPVVRSTKKCSHLL